MGVWGINIFDDDLAMDIRDEYINSTKIGLSAQEATSLIMEKFEDEMQDPDESHVIWLSLAAIQVESCTLLDVVKERALDIISSESDLERWLSDPDHYTGRKIILEQLKKQLLQSRPSL